MDVWMISRREPENELLEILSVLGDLQNQYDWIISDHDMWYSESCPDDVKKRWQQPCLLMSGKELTDHYSARYVWFCTGGILSAVPKGTKAEQVWGYVPGWERDFEDTGYRFQTPLTELEVVCFDGYAWLIVCKPDFSETVRKALPQACSMDEFYKR